MVEWRGDSGVGRGMGSVEGSLDKTGRISCCLCSRSYFTIIIPGGCRFSVLGRRPSTKSPRASPFRLCDAFGRLPAKDERSTALGHGR